MVAVLINPGPSASGGWCILRVDESDPVIGLFGLMGITLDAPWLIVSTSASGSCGLSFSRRWKMKRGKEFERGDLWVGVHRSRRAGNLARISVRSRRLLVWTRPWSLRLVALDHCFCKSFNSFRKDLMDILTNCTGRALRADGDTERNKQCDQFRVLFRSVLDWAGVLEGSVDQMISSLKTTAVWSLLNYGEKSVSVLWESPPAVKNDRSSNDLSQSKEWWYWPKYDLRFHRGFMDWA